VCCRGQAGEGGGRHAHRHGARAGGAGGRAPGEMIRPLFEREELECTSDLGLGNKWLLIPRSGMGFAGEEAV
jgi:hypothetical protein